jgi:hypothetical protein
MQWSHGQRLSRPRSGTIPRKRVPIRPIRGRWPAFIERRFQNYFWMDPGVIFDDKAEPEDFRGAIAALLVGETFKCTAAHRHAECDALLVDNVEMSAATIVDIGASDGSTSIDLIAKIPAFKSYVVADLYLTAWTVTVYGHTLFYEPGGDCILVSGAKCLAWPGLSKLVRHCYAPLIAAAARRPELRREALLLNPECRALVAADARVTVRVHDVFQPWEGEPPDVIKVANLLRRLYFSDEDICAALDALLASLPEGGHLLIVDNPYIDGIAGRAGLYRRQDDRFVAVAYTDEIPEINDLVLRGDPDVLVGSQETNTRRPATRRS